MKKFAFVLSSNEERFNALHALLQNNGYIHEQSWDDLESDIKKFESLDIKWPENIRDSLSPQSMSLKSINQVKEILLGGYEDFDNLPIMYIIEKDLPIGMCAEEVFACIKYTVEYLDGNSADLPVVYLFNELKREVALSMNTKYVHISPKFEKTEFEIEKFLYRLNNPDKVLSWSMKNL